MKSKEKKFILINLSIGYVLFIIIGIANGLQPVILAWIIGVSLYVAGALALFKLGAWKNEEA